MLTFIISYLAVFIFSDYKNLYLLSILHLYPHLFAELVHLYNLPLYWVCWGHKRFLVFGCRVVWERPSSSYTSHGLINLRSSTWGKIATVLQNSALGGPTRVYKNKVASRHHSTSPRSLDIRLARRPPVANAAPPSSFPMLWRPRFNRTLIMHANVYDHDQGLTGRYLNTTLKHK